MMAYNADVTPENETSWYILIHAEDGLKQHQKFLYVFTSVSLALPLLFCVIATYLVR
jgi:hypothetical protein